MSSFPLYANMTGKSGPNKTLHSFNIRALLKTGVSPATSGRREWRRVAKGVGFQERRVGRATFGSEGAGVVLVVTDEGDSRPWRRI